MRTTVRYRLTGSLPYRTATGAGHFETGRRQSPRRGSLRVVACPLSGA
ncbi:hypothetical protein [Streptomyces sp. NPDC054783]